MAAGDTDFSCEDILPDCKFPGDVMVSILCNLPVKSLFKFKSVSKPLYSLISSPRFIKMHLHCQAITSNNLILSSEELVIGLFTPNNHNKNRDVLILECPLVSLGKPYWIIDSCNGLVLVCLYSFVSSVPWVFILWNPATRKCRTIELPGGNFTLSFFTYGLCYVEATNDFKIVGWSKNHSPVNRRPGLCVYSLSSDSWLELNYDAKNYPVVYGPPAFMSGCMHWLLVTSSFEYFIAAFDVRDMTLCSYGVPDNCCGFGRTVNHTLVIRGCLSIVILLGEGLKLGFEVWVMEEYGVEGSWIKLFTINRLKLPMFPLISWNDGEIVFIVENEVSKILMFCDPYSEKKYSFEFKYFKARQVFSYVESLESVGMAKNVQQPKL